MDRRQDFSIADEKRLVRRAASGDERAFEQLVIAHQRFAYNLALRSLGDPLEAEDITQEAFLRAWKSLPRFKAKSRFSTWLYRIVVNLCYDRLPDLRRAMEAADPDDLAEIVINGAEQGTYDFPEFKTNPERSALIQDRIRYLQAEIENLPNKYGMMVLLRYALEYRYEEIASVLDVPLGTVKNGLHRARKMLRASLINFEETPTYEK